MWMAKTGQNYHAQNISPLSTQGAEHN